MKAFKILALMLVFLTVFSMVGCFSNNPDEPHYNPNVNPNDPNGGNETPNSSTHTVIFDYNDGSGRKETVKIPHGKTIAEYAIYPTEGAKEVVAWSGTADGAEYQAPVTSDITVYAQWETYDVKTYTYTSDIPDTINDKIVEIDVSEDPSVFENKVLRIGAAVRSIFIKSNSSKIRNFAIMINDRSADLELRLEDLVFSTNHSFGIDSVASNSYTVNLKISGTCLIDCTEYIIAKGSGSISCINIGKLELDGNGKLTLLASHGENGKDMPAAANGHHGDDGTSGTGGGCGIIAESITVKNITLAVYGGNGGNGGNGGAGNVANVTEGGEGGDGGNGGNGGDAIRTGSFKSYSATLTLIGGEGGDGGKGGKGGGGGIGGIPGLNTYKDGGNGGRGGNGGSVLNSMIQTYESNASVTEFTPGNGGAGGARGGGGKGQEGANGADGARGEINAK